MIDCNTKQFHHILILSQKFRKAVYNQNPLQNKPLCDRQFDIILRNPSMLPCGRWLENVLKCDQNIDQITNKQIIINSFILSIAVDGQKHVLGGKRSGVLRERQASMSIFWLQLKEQLLHAPLCVVSCFASVHNEQNYPSFSFNWRKSIIHIIGPAGHFKAVDTYYKPAFQYLICMTSVFS